MSMLTPIPLDLRHVRGIVRAMYRVAQADGVNDRELALMRGFYESCRDEVSGLADFGDVIAQALDLAEAHEAVATPELREVIVRSCLLAGWADGVLTDGERAVVAEVARAVGMDDATLAHVEESTKDQLVGAVARVPDTAAVARLRAKMG